MTSRSRELLPYLWKAATRGFVGPLILLLLGFALGLVAVPGPWPGVATFASYALAFLVYEMMARLSTREYFHLGVSILVIVALILTPFAFGPGPILHRKIMGFNAWAYELGAYLPAILPPPHPNGVAGLLVTALGLTGGLAFYGSGWHRRWATLVVVVLVIALALTACRAGWLAGVAVLMLLSLRLGHRWLLLMLAISGLIITALVMGAGQPLPGHPAILSTESFFLRIEQWRHTIALLQQHPITGLGLGRFPYIYAQAVADLGKEAVATPHNVLLQLWADAGILGLAALGCAVVQACYILITLSRQHRLIRGWYVAGLGSALVALAMHGLSEANIVIVGAVGGDYVHLASPLPFAVLGLLAGLGRRCWVSER